MKRKAFFTKNSPKSFIVCVTAILFGLLVAAPIALAGKFAAIEVINELGLILFWCCLLIAGFFGAIFAVRSVAGKYKTIKETSWREQLW
ncbi:hypothetical protein [Alteromonas flava]|uniref:hypothetical protein n=1 Tax=Alteromonas flava TaxID=2048003 RepID=UPI000C2845F6|nr:hypothetical protein [Alteromonas flava]